MSTAAEGILGSAPRPAPRSRRHSPRIAAHGKLTVLTLAAATYFMVSGGPYGLEDIVKMAGYAGAIAILLITPLLWSVPTAMMVSELSSSIPEEGGFYIWVRRGLGNFWGYQETWLSLAGSIFEMALYPTLFVDYLGHFAPALTAGHRAIIIELGLILICTLWNLWGTRAVGEGSVWMSLALLSRCRGMSRQMPLCACLHAPALQQQQVMSRQISCLPLPSQHTPSDTLTSSAA